MREKQVELRWRREAEKKRAPLESGARKWWQKDEGGGYVDLPMDLAEGGGYGAVQCRDARDRGRRYGRRLSDETYMAVFDVYGNRRGHMPAMRFSHA